MFPETVLVQTRREKKGSHEHKLADSGQYCSMETAEIFHNIHEITTMFLNMGGNRYIAYSAPIRHIVKQDEGRIVGKLTVTHKSHTHTKLL